MMHGFQQIVTQTERRDNFVVHGLPPLGDEMGVSPLLWRKKLMDSISSNLGYTRKYRRSLQPSPWGAAWWYASQAPVRRRATIAVVISACSEREGRVSSWRKPRCRRYRL